MYNKSVSPQKGAPEKSFWWITSSYSCHQALESSQSMDADQLYDFLKEKTNDDIAECLKKNKITGKMLASLTEDQIKEMLPAIGDRIQLIELLKQSPASSLHANATTRAEATACTSQCLLKKELLKRASGGSLAAIAATKHWNLLNKAIRMAVMKTEVRVI